LNGLRVYVAECDAVPAEVAPPPSLRKYWTRRGIAEWLRICTVWGGPHDAAPRQDQRARLVDAWRCAGWRP